MSVKVFPHIFSSISVYWYKISGYLFWNVYWKLIHASVITILHDIDFVENFNVSNLKCSGRLTYTLAAIVLTTNKNHICDFRTKCVFLCAINTNFVHLREIFISHPQLIIVTQPKILVRNQKAHYNSINIKIINIIISVITIWSHWLWPFGDLQFILQSYRERSTW